MFNRDVIHKFEKWAATSPRKPLILRGARQVGKTSAVDLFGKKFDAYISLNLEKNEDRRLFEQGLPVKDLYQAIRIHKNVLQTKGRTLLFIDEIQHSIEAIGILRYFFEELPELFVISAGSLLDPLIKQKKVSFPVGRVSFVYMYPLSFREYLAALEETQLLEQFEKIPFPNLAFQILLDHFHRYTLLGGMPEVIQHYLKTRDIASLGDTYHSLLSTYLDDVEKYATGASSRIIRHCIETAPSETGKRIHFEGFGNSNYKSREIGEALRTLEQVMLLYLLYPTTSTELPASRNLKKSPRLQFLDSGLLNYSMRLQEHFFTHKTLHDFYKGLIAEQIVGQELLCASKHHEKPLFWVREKKQSSAEVDFVFPYKGFLFPIEVKSGKTGTLRSLHQFVERSDHPHALRLYAGPYQREEHKTPLGKHFILHNIPYFLASQVGAFLEKI